MMISASRSTIQDPETSKMRGWLKWWDQHKKMNSKILKFHLPYLVWGNNKISLPIL
jgi:hypothetical protein